MSSSFAFLRNNKLKITKRLSETVILRKRDNTIAKGKKHKRQTMVDRTLNRKLNIELQESH